MRDYAEKRDFYRMAVDCTARYRVKGEQAVQQAMVRDLSASGLQLRTDQELTAGAVLNVEIRPAKEITPPLHAVAKVIRCTPSEEAGGGFSIACAIEQMLPVDQVGADFP
ncbi:PilZ domain-containing protein [Sedimenticola thiotaurini]|uniref:Ferredoxin n=1 Tax=Sedimenticola thiotaurini TaxID=1543721 RepID=A0A0F7K0Y3_9GAMM|nr:PilZ domain-containing protein [Sedimenticola thiotaurini]AKH21254.1 ferredoxin [Sedimenticola thiotaurini]